MEAKTISKIQSYIKKNSKLNNSELARLIINDGALNYTEGSLKNYIAQVKSMPAKVVSTIKGNVTRDSKDARKDSPKEASTRKSVAPEATKSAPKREVTSKTEELKKPLTIQEHIAGYLVAYEGKSYGVICSTMKANGIGTQFTDGTLRNYISAVAKGLNDNKNELNTKSSAELLKSTKKASVKLMNHEVFVVDTKVADSYNMTHIIDNLSTDVDSRVTLVAFDENVNVMANCTPNPSFSFQSEKDLGINLINAITTAVSLAMNSKAKDAPTNVTIITSGGDNKSIHTTYEDVKWMLDEIKTNHNWNVNLVFAGQRSEEAIRLGLLLGIDSSNITTKFDTYKIINSINKRISKVQQNAVIIAANYYK